MSGGRQLTGVTRGWLKLHNLIVPCRRTTTVASTVDQLDDFAARLVNERTRKWRKNTSPSNHEHEATSVVNRLLRQEVALKPNHRLNNDIDKLPSPSEQTESLEQKILSALSKNKHDDIEHLLSQNETNQISEDTLTKIFSMCSNAGRVDKVLLLQKFCETQSPDVYARNAQFVHFVAKAHCLRGNSEEGLSILTDVYENNVNFRCLYRTIIRELIHDSATNRSVASQVVFRKYVVSWSERWSDHYPLVCFWHSCWVSTWFSDQMLSVELIDLHEPLREIVEDRASALSITALRYFREDDAVVRLLQTLLKYKMMDAYVKVLQTLFDFRLKKGDKRGCLEILQNCKILGLTMSSDHQGKCIHMIIDGEHIFKTPSVDNFKLKF